MTTICLYVDGPRSSLGPSLFEILQELRSVFLSVAETFLKLVFVPLSL